MTKIGSESLLHQMRMMAAEATAQDNKTNTIVGGDFANILAKAVESVNDSQQLSANLKTAYEQGVGDVSLVDVMLASQKAGLEFQAMVQVRNKLVQAYQDIMNMPI